MCYCFFLSIILGTFGYTYGYNSSFLSVVGNHFMLHGETVFLSGANQAWISFGHDFGNGNYRLRKASLERYLMELRQNGGNSLRIWIHIAGYISPHFDANGYVIGLDRDGTFLSELADYLDLAGQYNILVFLCLWNGAFVDSKTHHRLDGLINDPKRLQSYIDNALIPWVEAVKGYPSLGGWDIMNEPEGKMLTNIDSAEPCFDTRSLHLSGAGWTRYLHTAENLQRFINWQADAIHRTDPKALVTVGVWNPRSATDRLCMTDFYKDTCLIKAGQRSQGTLDFYQIHTYDRDNHYDDFSPFKLKARDYGHTKPIVIGEFNQVRGAGMDIAEQFISAYTKKYNGAWSWHARADGTHTDTWEIQKNGIRALANAATVLQGGRVNITLGAVIQD